MNNVTNGSGFFKKQLPLSFGIVVVLIFGLAGIYFNSNKEIKPVKDTTAVATNFEDNAKLRRQSGFSYVHPLLIAEIVDQSENLFQVRNQIKDYITEHQDKDFSDVSFHLKKLNTGEWIGLNQDKEYSSRGYLRIAVLITFLKMSERDRSILNHQIVFNKAPGSGNYPLLSLTPGKSYSISNLLEQMMTSADTTPKFLLIPFIDRSVLMDLYEPLGLGRPDFRNNRFSITTVGYSKLLNVIYNGRFLNENNSEYALKLLSNNKDKVGLLKLLPEQSKVVHKMVQRFKDNQYELRETGIMYCNNESYLLTIFITGKNEQGLEKSCGEIGKLVYEEVSIN